MSTGFELQAEQRPELHRSASRRLRHAGKVPAIVYGGGKAPQPVTLDHNTLLRHMEREAFYTSILTLKVGADAQAVVVKDVQRHPARPQLLHLDFQRIVEDEEITLHVPIHFLGEETAVGVKDHGGVLEHLMTDVEVTCLPRYLPEYLELDVSKLELNDILHLSDIPLPEGVEVVALAHKQDHAVVSISPPRRADEEEAEAEVEVAAEAVPAGEDTEDADKGEAED